jgi:elongation factor P hydroxylase
VGAAVHSPSAQAFRSARLERVFTACFGQSLQTRLVGGAPEPLYTPATQEAPESTIYYREDYFASALHEVAHWCIAGEERRQQLDFGYWYAPDGRSPQQQAAFEQVEYKPQALEWFFSKACAIRFSVSVDNLQGFAAVNVDQASGFKHSVLDQALYWQREPLPGRALSFYQALCIEFGTDTQPTELDFTLAELV